MSTNCVRCVANKRTGFDLLCDDCRESKGKEVAMSEASKTPVTERFFSFGCDGEFEFHSTEQAAKDAAQSEIDRAHNWAADSDWRWPDNTGGICWGEVRGRAAIEDSEPTDEQKANNPEWTFVREVSLEDYETQLTTARADSERLAAALEKVESANNGIGDAWEALARIETISTEALSAHKALNQNGGEGS